MKGKYATRSDARREIAAEATAARLAAELASEQHLHHGDVQRLETEIRRLRSEHRAEAQLIADREIERREAIAAEERRKRGMSDDMSWHASIQLDRLVFNACRYLSMTEGKGPSKVLPRVITWLTDEDYYGVTDATRFAVKLGLPLDGWTVRKWQGAKHARRQEAKRNIEAGRTPAISLDHALEQGHEGIHPDYKPGWYAGWSYENEVEIVDDDEDAT